MFEIDIECPICFNQYSDLSFNIDDKEVVRYTLNPCNHVCCKECANRLKNCFYCCVKIDKKTKHISKSNKDGGLRRAVGLSTELKYFLINFCNCTLLNIQKNNNRVNIVNIISDYVSSNGLNHPIDKKFILITPELKDLLITDDSDYSKIEEDENGEKRYYTSYFKLLELLVKKEHLIKI